MQIIMITSNVVLYMCVASHAFVNNLFGNFPGSSESKESLFYEPLGVIIIFVLTLAPLVVQMFVMQGTVALYDNCAIHNHTQITHV